VVPYLLGKQHELTTCATATGQFIILALDHHQNLHRELRPATPDDVTYDQMVDFKLAVTRALASTATGILLDPEVGAGQAIADGAVPAGTGLIVALEATGYAGPSTARGSRVLPGWSAAAAKRIGASAAKLLVYYHPEASNAADQEALVAAVATDCRELDLALFIKPLSFALDGGKLTGEDRRRVVIETARRLTPLGMDVLKAEFPYEDSVTDHARWAEACAELDDASAVPWVLLSGGVDHPTFEIQVELACDAGASGALVGRSVWAGAALLAEPARSDFLATTAAERLARLASSIGRHGRSWVPRWDSAVAPDRPGEGWYTKT